MKGVKLILTSCIIRACTLSLLHSGSSYNPKTPLHSSITTCQDLPMQLGEISPRTCAKTNVSASLALKLFVTGDCLLSLAPGPPPTPPPPPQHPHPTHHPSTHSLAHVTGIFALLCLGIKGILVAQVIPGKYLVSKQELRTALGHLTSSCAQSRLTPDDATEASTESLTPLVGDHMVGGQLRPLAEGAPAMPSQPCWKLMFGHNCRYFPESPIVHNGRIYFVTGLLMH